jgi:hypothetical protein
MKEVHIREQIHNGDRSDPYVGIAHFRLLTKGKISTGDIRVFIDYQEKVIDPEAPNGYRYKLTFPLPFQISCQKVALFPSKPLNDYHHTVVHYVPISAMRQVNPAKHGAPRVRTMPQSEFQKIKATAKQIECGFKPY